MLYSWGPEKIRANDNKVGGIDLVRCTSVFDDEGNFCPCFDDTKKSIAADQVILAIGQASETAFCQDFCFLDKAYFCADILIHVPHLFQKTISGRRPEG